MVVAGLELRDEVAVFWKHGKTPWLTVVHTERDGAARVISFRPASRIELEVYDAWLENECDEP